MVSNCSLTSPRSHQWSAVEKTENIDTNLLFQAWTTDLNGPHADFVISSNAFYLVDFDGDGNKVYSLSHDTLSVALDASLLTGKIIAVNKDSLIIQWKDDNAQTCYLRWKE